MSDAGGRGGGRGGGNKRRDDGGGCAANKAKKSKYYAVGMLDDGRAGMGRDGRVRLHFQLLPRSRLC